jgi:hypothetical protein
VVILRHVYGLSRSSAAQLPMWEFDLLVASGRSIIGLDASEDGELSDADVRRIIT